MAPGLAGSVRELGETPRDQVVMVRVDEATYERAVADKQDDGIIQNNLVGRKRRGVLEREYTVPTTGAAITEW